MDPNYSSILSGGYRDVALNLKILSAWTKSMGLDMHVCEVQLILKAFAEVKVSQLPHIRLLTCHLTGSLSPRNHSSLIN